MIFKSEFLFLYYLVKTHIKRIGFHFPLKLVSGLYSFHNFLDAVYERFMQKWKKKICCHESIFDLSLSVSLLTGKWWSFWAHECFTNQQIHVEFAHKQSFSIFYNVNSQMIWCSVFPHTMKYFSDTQVMDKKWLKIQIFFSFCHKTVKIEGSLLFILICSDF